MSLSLSRKVLSLAVLLWCGTVTAWAAEDAADRGMSPEQIAHLRGFPAVDNLSVNEAGVPTLVSGKLGYVGFGPVDRTAGAYVARILPLFKGTGDERFRTLRVQRDDDGTAHVRLEEQYRGLPIVGAELIVHVREGSGEVTGVNGRFVRADRLPVTPTVAAERALDVALHQAAISSYELLEEPYLTYVANDDGTVHLAWAARVAYVDDQGYQTDRVFADAVDGSLAAKHALIWRAKYRKIYTANNGTALPGTLLFNEGGSHADFDAQKAYEYAGNTYDYYSARHARDSWNGSGGNIVASVHYGVNENNAFWSNNQMAFGDGDGFWAPAGRALDIVAHEFTHGVTQATANLTYSNESGALNEAMSDIFGNAAEAYVRGTSSNTWKVAEDIYTPSVSGDALRYMNNPTQDGSSKDYYPERYTGGADFGGVHWNSGIANLAFYLVSQGGSHPRGKTSVVVPSIGITTAEKIFYRALKNYMTSSTNFQGAREATMLAVTDLHGGCSTQFDAVQKTWDAVGVPRGTGREYEPNDLYNTANPLTPYSSYAIGYICTSGNQDWFSINKLYSYSVLSISLYPPANADYDLELWQGSMIGQSANTGNGVSEQLYWYYGTGNFYIKVVPKGSSTSTSSYSLTVSQ